MPFSLGRTLFLSNVFIFISACICLQGPSYQFEEMARAQMTEWEPSRLRVVAEKFRKILGSTVSRGLYSCKLPEDRALFCETK